MVSLAYGFAWGLLALSILGFASVIVGISRQEEFPGRRAFLWTNALFALGLSAFTLLSIFTQLDTSGPIQPLLLITAFATILSVPITWVRFALQYTGQRVPTGRRTLLRLGIPVLLTVSIIVLSVGFQFLRFGLGIETIPEATFDYLGSILEYTTAVTAFYLVALLVGGASIIAWTSYSFRHLSKPGGILVGVGVVVPWAAAVMPAAAQFFTGQPLVYAYHVAGGSVIGSGAMWLAVDRYELFRNVPAAGTVGRDMTVEEMNDPVLVTDGAGQVIDLNPAAERAFRTSVESIGQPLTAIFDEAEHSEELLTEPSGAEEITQGTRTFETTTSELHDDHGHLLGHSFVFHDVTERKQREQRIQVLNRVLRHNLRNDLTAVNGFAELLEEAVTDATEYAIKIQRIAADLMAIGEKARQIEAVVSAQQQTRDSTLKESVEQAVSAVQESHSDCEITTTFNDGDESVNGTVLTAVVGELIENACRHNDADDPRVVVETTTDGDHQITIKVTDNGPGIPEHELAPLEEGSETALEHGSGLGLWLINWGVATVGGSIEFQSKDPRGTVAKLQIPTKR